MFWIRRSRFPYGTFSKNLDPDVFLRLRLVRPKIETDYDVFQTSESEV